MKGFSKLKTDRVSELENIKPQRPVVRKRRALKGGEGNSIEVRVRKKIDPLFEVMVPA